MASTGYSSQSYLRSAETIPPLAPKNWSREIGSAVVSPREPAQCQHPSGLNLEKRAGSLESLTCLTALINYRQRVYRDINGLMICGLKGPQYDISSVCVHVCVCM